MSGARLVVWDDEACWQVHEATLALLEETGVDVPWEPARALLAAAGARVDGTRVRIPTALVDGALAAAPRRFTLAARGGAGGGTRARRRTQLLGTGPDCVYVRDPDSGQRRPATAADVEGMAALCELLPGIDFVMSMGLPADVPAEADDSPFAAMLAGTRKPLLATARDADSLPRMREHGGALRRGATASPATPCPRRRWPTPARRCDKIIACAELGIPLVYAPAPAAG